MLIILKSIEGLILQKIIYFIRDIMHLFIKLSVKIEYARFVDD